MSRGYRFDARLAKLGSDNGSAKLLEEDIPVIRELCKTFSYRNVAERYYLHPCTIRDIIIGKTWRHVP